MKRMALLLIVMIAMVLLVWWRLPLIGNEWSKQTIYVGLLDAWHGSSTDDIAYAMWILPMRSESNQPLQLLRIGWSLWLQTHW